jgi:AcrR family transcriptional regulator
MARSVGIDRGQVVASAAELADEHGLDQLALAQVAARLGVKLPSLYNHVAGLPGLRRELALLALRQLQERMSRATIGKSGDGAVMALALAYRGYATEHPGLYAATVRAPEPGDQAHLQASQAIIEVVLAVLEPYRLGEAGAIHAVRGLRSIVHGFATLEQAGGFGIPLDREESFLRLVRGFIAGLHTTQ